MASLIRAMSSFSRSRAALSWGLALFIWLPMRLSLFSIIVRSEKISSAFMVVRSRSALMPPAGRGMAVSSHARITLSSASTFCSWVKSSPEKELSLVPPLRDAPTSKYFISAGVSFLGWNISSRGLKRASGTFTMPTLAELLCE
ncbi:MAG: hypothetical protein EGMGGAKC_00646 [Dehalococcoides mccartyi]|nr:hypothetical protein [Dehalococcoides mccartyi]